MNGGPCGDLCHRITGSGTEEEVEQVSGIGNNNNMTEQIAALLSQRVSLDVQ